MASIYIHIPFCKTKCIYCNFYSVVSTKDIETYISVLCQEIENRSSAQRIHTIYFGGGTPTLLPIQSLEKIMGVIHKNFRVDSNAEITIEGNPDQCTVSDLIKLKKLGFNRLSIGAQSFNDKILQFLGRTHSGKDALLAVENAVNAGFENISIDLMYGISLRLLQDWEQELKTAFLLPVKHLSAYALTVEENTRLHKIFLQYPKQEKDEESTLHEMQLLMNEAENNSFEHYEVSNFAMKGFYSKHNSNYWNGTHYLGFGASAHSFNGTIRRWNIQSVKKYIEAIKENEPFFETETLTPEDLYNEYILLRLRTKEGIDLKHLEETLGKERLNFFLVALKKLNPLHYKIEDGRVSVTRAGMPILDFVAVQLWLE